jgi:hypothetical protein
MALESEKHILAEMNRETFLPFYFSSSNFALGTPFHPRVSHIKASTRQFRKDTA